MTNTIRVMTYEISRTFRRRGYLFTTFGLPVLLFALSFLWRTISPTPADMMRSAGEIAEQFGGLDIAGVVDQSGLFTGVESDQILHFADEAEAMAALERGEIEAIYILPADFAETGQAREIIPRMALDDITDDPIQTLAYLALQAELPEGFAGRLRQPALISAIDLNAVVDGNGGASSDLTPEQREDANFAVVYLFAILFMMASFTGSGYLMQSVIEEKENRLIEVLITSVRPSQLLAGKVVAQGIMALFQIAMWIVIGFVLFSTQGDFLTQNIPFLASIVIPTTPLPFVAVYFLLGYFMFAAVFGMVGALSNSAQEGPQYTVVFVLPALIPLFVLPSLVTEPNGTLAVALSLFPITAPLGMISRLVVTSVPPLEIAISLALLVAATIGMYWLAGRMFRVQTLLSGRVPRLRDLPRLVFSRS